MKANIGMARNVGGIFIILGIGLIALAVAFPTPAWTQGQSDDMKVLSDKIKMDKKLLVAQNMDLTEEEGKAFWPVYDEYQKDLTKINQRITRLIESYADDYQKQTLTDKKATKLTDELISIEKAEAKLKESYVPKLGKVLPPKKVARYLQIENKIRAIVKYQLADAVPLVP